MSRWSRCAICMPLKGRAGRRVRWLPPLRQLSAPQSSTLAAEPRMRRGTLHGSRVQTCAAEPERRAARRGVLGAAPASPSARPRPGPLRALAVSGPGKVLQSQARLRLTREIAASRFTFRPRVPQPQRLLLSVELSSNYSADAASSPATCRSFSNGGDQHGPWLQVILPASRCWQCMNIISVIMDS